MGRSAVRLGIFARHDARDVLHFVDLADVNSVSESSESALLSNWRIQGVSSKVSVYMYLV